MLYADLIPQNKFHYGEWLLSDNGWYYFYPCERENIIPINKNFYLTVDEPLIEIIEHLHNLSIPTTPSCSGHFNDLKFNLDLYDNILNDNQKITTKKIKLYNPENNKKYLYSNKNFSMPWNKKEFLNSIFDYQTKGVIGIFDIDKKIFNFLLEKLNVNRNKTIKISHDPNKSITLILTYPTSNIELLYNWKNVTKIIKKLLSFLLLI